jgi:hypothetical protein
VTKNMADRPLNLSKINHDFLSFDSAQAEGDRNLLGHFQDGVDVDLEERVWGLHYLEQKQKSAEGLQYYRDSTNWIYGYAKKMKIKSGDLIVDWTGRPAQAEMLKEMEFMSHQLVYNMGVPDGKRTSPVTKRVERPIIIYEGFDESGNVDVRRRVYAHQVADNMISLGAYFLQEYVKSGRVRGMNRAMMNFLSSSHSIEEEMFSRKFKKKVSKLYGDLLQLVSKDEFKEDFGFSPDLMDIWFQAAFYMFMVRKMPLSPINGTDQNIVFNPEDTSVLMDDHNNIWKGDSLETYGYDGVLSDY